VPLSRGWGKGGERRTAFRPSKRLESSKTPAEGHGEETSGLWQADDKERGNLVLRNSVPLGEVWGDDKG